MESAPRDGTKIIADIPEHGKNNVILWRAGFLNAKGQECGAWIFVEENLKNYPADWTDAVCWESN